jgi:hypothetical protein
VSEFEREFLVVFAILLNGEYINFCYGYNSSI